MEEIDVRELAANREAYLLLDVRENAELALAAIPSAIHIPIGEITRRWREVDLDCRIAVLCHHGVRSGQVARFLVANGIDAVNVAGGIDAWSARVDPGVPRY